MADDLVAASHEPHQRTRRTMAYVVVGQDDFDLATGGAVVDQTVGAQLVLQYPAELGNALGIVTIPAG